VVVVIVVEVVVDDVAHGSVGSFNLSKHHTSSCELVLKIPKSFTLIVRSLLRSPLLS